MSSTFDRLIKSNIYRTKSSFKHRRKRRRVKTKSAPNPSPTLRRFQQKLFRNQTYAEKLFWILLKRNKLDKYFKRQIVLFGYIVDFFSARHLLVVEIDGGYHNNEFQKYQDSVRSEALTKHGMRVLRFTNNEVIQRPKETMDQLSKHISTISKVPKYKTPLGCKVYISGRYSQDELKKLVPSLNI